MSISNRLAALKSVMREAMAQARAVKPGRVDKKAHQDYVTDVDLAVDAFLTGALAPLVPGAPVLSEERATGLAGRIEPFWVVDPIDGTLNLMAGVPFVGISVALVDHHGPVLAAVASLGDDALYLAERDAGAWRFGADDTAHRLTIPAMPPELVVLSSGMMDAIIADGGTRWPAVRSVGKLRNFGAQALHLCGVAEGRFAAVGSIEACVWDEAAGGLIVREAGGLWTSAADAEDWGAPARLMGIRQQRSLACHPSVAVSMRGALVGLLASATARGNLNDDIDTRAVP